MNQSRTQKGVALITALIITMIAVSLAATVIYRQQIQIRLSSNIGHLEQAYLYANGMEDWAGTFLKKSYEDHPKFDSLEDDWANDGKLISLPIDGGVMNGQIFDLQARLNLNSLIIPKPPKPKKDEKLEEPNQKKGKPKNPNAQQGDPNAPQKVKEKPKPHIAEINRARIINLLTQKVDPDQEMGPPENFVDILKDWIDNDQTNGNHSTDPDDEISGNGAESPYYQSMEPAYFSADTQMISLTELRLLKEMKKEIYTKLIDYVSVLPIDTQDFKSQIPINVNTAEKEVLQSLGLTPEIVENIIKERKESPFESKKSFLNFVSNELKTNPDLEHDIDVKSSYFLLKGSVNINNARVFINSILVRKNGQVSVIMRDFSNP